MENQKLVDQFNKNSVEVVKVHLQEWKAQLYVDLRAWLLPNPAESGAEQATKKGLTLNVDLLPRLIQALQKAEKALEKEQKKAEFGPERPQETRSQED